MRKLCVLLITVFVYSPLHGQGFGSNGSMAGISEGSVERVMDVAGVKSGIGVDQECESAGPDREPHGYSFPTDAAMPGGSTHDMIAMGQAETPRNVLETMVFVASRKRGEVVLSWEADGEAQGEVFNVERSLDGAVWREIGVVGARMNVRNYVYNDEIDGSLPGSVQLLYRLRRIRSDGSSVYSCIVPVNIAARDGGVELYDAYPNPFNTNTHITFSLDVQSPVTLSVCDQSGRSVATLAEEAFMEAGIHSAEFRANNLPGGMYTVVLRAGTSMRLLRILLRR